MKPSSPQKFYGLDHLRALAILLVFLFHYYILSDGQPEWLPDLASFGWTGVDLFFVLSGFLIANQLFAEIKQKQQFSLKVFFLKRVFRILPAYWVVLAFYFLVPFFREKTSLPPLWKFLSFTQNLGLNLKQTGAFSHAWSLCVEEHFYLFLPLVLVALLAAKKLKKGYWLLFGLFALGFVVRYISYQAFMAEKANGGNAVHWYQYVYYPTYNRLDGLLAGVAIAAMHQFFPGHWQKIAHYGNWLIMLGLAVLTGAYFLCEDQMTLAASLFGFPLVALGYGCLVMGAISPVSFLYKYSSRITSHIAALSFAIYLSHKGVIHVTHQLLSGYTINPNILLVICIATCTVAAQLLHWLVEKPFMQWRKKLVKEK